MRRSREETARTRERIVTAASKEFREHGIVATGLADLMKAAGLTHGGFYKHFSSKDELVKEVAATSIATTTARIKEPADKRSGRAGIAEAVATYLSEKHRDEPGDGCVFASIGAELGRTDCKTKAEATEGFLKFVEVFASHAQGMRPEQAKKTAIAAAAAMIGAMTLSRMVEDPKLSQSILKTVGDSIVRSFD